MPEKSKRINMFDKSKVELINPESLRLLERYETAMVLKGLSKNTIEQYKADLYQWLIYVLDKQGNMSVKELVEDDLTEFLGYCQAQGNNGNRMKRRMSSISAFYKFLKKKKMINENPMENVDRPTKVQRVAVQTYLTKEDVALMKEKLKEHGDLQLETYALLSLSTMARVNAIANLRWEQIKIEERKCVDVLEKEGKIVELYFSEEVKQLLIKLIEYRKENDIDDHGWLWYTSKTTEKNPVDTTTLNDWCKRIGSMINYPTLHAHDFRHSGATLLKHNGMNLEDIADLLHHESTDVTKKFYIKEDSKKIVENKDKFEI